MKGHHLHLHALCTFLELLLHDALIAHRVAKAVKDAEMTQQSASEALQQAAMLQGKIEVLQRALQKAEERAAKSEFQVCHCPCTLGNCASLLDLHNLQHVWLFP